MTVQPMPYAAACAIVDERSSRQCERCGKTVLSGGHHHHRKLRSRGGLDCPSNLVFVCAGCHNWIHANPALATEAGWMVGTRSDPEGAAIDSARYGRVFLGTDGQLYGLTPDECLRAERAARLAATAWPRTTTSPGVHP
ncbi:HNH endonuclease [Agrococcus sp. Marseille-Q4369]|uniref:HNH endonuclease n=1 Tax=Agrococcus sp. Marseille-Q4369 TaxID=2810513 RepID=UPI001B8AD956|nr:HNH endonuclease [Agrococcus sp. Marseille-Q4369]QUW18866.1 HNH endonuclease [Agrococcus sp. Marseille-Q4369]